MNSAHDDELNGKGGDEESSNKLEEEERKQDATTTISHFRNELCHPSWLRYGVPIYLVATFVLLLNADIGSGISADYILRDEEGIVEQRPLLTASIFTSVRELWRNKTFPLAIFIAVTSISWPYVKLVLSLYAWIRPFQSPRRRELLIEVVDALGKWSFVDIIVFVIIMVAFRSTVALTPTVTLEIIIVPKWGFYGFVLATILSLLGSHAILYYHRKVIYQNTGMDGTVQRNAQAEGVEEGQAPNRMDISEQSKITNLASVIALVGAATGIAFYLVGCIVNVMEMSNASQLLNEFSIISIGLEIPPSSLDPSDAGIRFIQAMWFFLGVAMPIWCTCLFACLYGYIAFGIAGNINSTNRGKLEWTFLMAEVAFSWSGAEVLLISTLFAVLQLPTFGNGLVEANCEVCPRVGSRLVVRNFIFLLVGTAVNVGVAFWLYRKTHALLFHSKRGL